MRRKLESPLRFKLSGLAKYQQNPRLFLLSFGLSVATFVVYALYFDILAPFIPGGSVRASSGLFFAVPVFLLLGGQTLFTTFLTYISIGAAAPDKKDVLKSYFVSSVEVLLYSVYYVLFPYYGAFVYVVYFMPGESFPLYSYPLVIAWTLAIIFATALVIRRVFRLENDPRIGSAKIIVLAATTLAVILAMAD